MEILADSIGWVKMGDGCDDAPIQGMDHPSAQRRMPGDVPDINVATELGDEVRVWRVARSVKVYDHHGFIRCVEYDSIVRVGLLEIALDDECVAVPGQPLRDIAQRQWSDSRP
ncbi:hypothetical protein GCM10009525_70870 [Streptosporangium amethystogenes subsp. fukuiense]